MRFNVFELSNTFNTVSCRYVVGPTRLFWEILSSDLNRISTPPTGFLPPLQDSVLGSQNVGAGT